MNTWEARLSNSMQNAGFLRIGYPSPEIPPATALAGEAQEPGSATAVVRNLESCSVISGRPAGPSSPLAVDRPRIGTGGGGLL